MAPVSPWIRRAWPELIALAIGVALLVADVAVYRPAQARMQRAERAAQDLGVSLDPSQRPALIPEPVQRFVLANSVAAAQATSAGRTGQFTAELLSELSALAGRSGLVVTATEPGITLDLGPELVVRARVRARGGYASFVGFLGALGASQHLLTVDQFALTAGEGAQCAIELWVTRHVLKRAKPARTTP